MGCASASLLLPAVLAGAAGGSCNVREFQALGDGAANDRAAIQRTVDACGERGGGTVIIPAGIYRSGTIRLRDNINLHLEPGAVLRAIEDENELPVTGKLARRHLIVAERAKNIAITGEGTIEGSGADDYGWRWGVPMTRKFRSGLVMLTECERVRVEGVTLRWSESFTLVLDHSRDVVVHGITIDNNLHHENTDGIDIFSCEDVRISDCRISAGDDAIVLKSADGAPTQRILVTNSALNTTCSGLKFGTGTSGEFRDIHFSNLSIGYGEQGIGFFMKDGGTIEDVTFTGISMDARNPPTKYPTLADARRDPVVAPILADRKATFADYNIWLNINQYPILIDLNKRDSGSNYGQIRDVSFSGIHIRANSGMLIQGRPGHPILNLTFSNVRMKISGALDYTARHLSVGGTQNHHDEFDTVYARRPSYATFAWVDGLRLDGFQVDAEADRFDRVAADIDHCQRVDIRVPGSSRPEKTVRVQNSTRVDRP